MGNRYVKSAKKKKITYMEAYKMYGHSLSQPLLYDEIELWHGHPDFT